MYFVIIFVMLARQVTYPPWFPPWFRQSNSFVPILLRTLLRSLQSQLLWNQANPNSLRKTPRGCAYLRHRSCNCNEVRLNFITLCFHNLTNCFSRKLLLFTTIRHCPGVWGRFPKSKRTDAVKKTTPNSKFATPASPFNAVYRHSMHENTIQRKVWSQTADFGKLFGVTEGLRGQSKWVQG